MRQSGWKRIVVPVVALAVGMAVPAQAQTKDWPAATEGASPEKPDQQQQMSPEEMQQFMQGMMGPMMGEMMSVMLKAMASTLSEPEISANLATFTRNFYQALIAKGFSEEEAMRIVTSTGWPSVGGQQ